MPHPENFTPIQRFRLDDEVWERFGNLVGLRSRASKLKAYVEWQLANPQAELPSEPGKETVEFVVRVHLGSDSRQAEVVPLPGPAGKVLDDLRAEIVTAIVSHFKSEKPPGPEKPKPAKRARKAAK